MSIETGGKSVFILFMTADGETTPLRVRSSETEANSDLELVKVVRPYDAKFWVEEHQVM